MAPRRLSQSPDVFRPSGPESCEWGGVRDGAGTALAPSSFCASQIAAPVNLGAANLPGVGNSCTRLDSPPVVCRMALFLA